jgi:hypothetical protein
VIILNSRIGTPDNRKVVDVGEKGIQKERKHGDKVNLRG